MEPTDQSALLGSDGNTNYKSTQATSALFAQQNSLPTDCPKPTCNNIAIAIHNPSTCATASKLYSNMEKSFTHDYARALECSEVSTNVEEKYFDPGHSKVDIYACFERNKIHIVKNEDVRCVHYSSNVVMICLWCCSFSVCLYICYYL